MALLAGDLNVRPGQRETGLRMVELSGHLPVGSVVTALAFIPEAPLVFVLMAAGARF